MSIESQTVITCDVCGKKITAPTKAAAIKLARAKNWYLYSQAQYCQAGNSDHRAPTLKARGEHHTRQGHYT